jgi:hypothetical protein
LCTTTHGNTDRFVRKHLEPAMLPTAAWINKSIDADPAMPVDA